MIVRGTVNRYSISGLGLLLCIAGVKLFLHLIVNAISPLGYFRDELYYIAGSYRLDWGYVDHPPVIGLITRLALLLPGDFLLSLRFLPALAGAGTVLLAGLMARELGGDRWAQAIAALAMLIPPVLLATNDFLSTISFFYLLWVLCCYLVLRLLRTGDERLWLAIGLVLGVGLMTKHTMALLAFGLALGVLLTPMRSHLRQRWLWLGVLIAFVTVLPHLLWQMQYDWPLLEFATNAATLKNVEVGPLQFVLDQILAMNPIAFPLWLTGLYWLFRSCLNTRYRLLGYTYVVPFLILMATGSSRVDYLVPAYAVLFAAGGVAVAQFAKRRLDWLRPATVGALIVGGLVVLPGALPVLPVDGLVRYTQAMGLSDKPLEQGKTAPLPQWWADRFGWESMVETAAEVYAALPPEEQAQAVILTGNYGEAGAVELYGSAYDLPPVISGHNSYYLWGTQGASGEVVIALGVPERVLSRFWARVEQRGTIVCDYCMDYENDLPVYVVGEPNAPLDQIWSQLKHYN